MSVSREQVINAGHCVGFMEEQREHGFQLAPYLVYHASRISLHAVSIAHSYKLETNAIRTGQRY